MRITGRFGGRRADPFDIAPGVVCYALPEDHEAARTAFLDLIRGAGETWIIAHAFAVGRMVEAVTEAASRGGSFHLYLDHSQPMSSAELPDVGAMLQAGVEVTIGTATRGGLSIAHTKGLAADLPEGPACWQGSVDLSLTPGRHVNAALRFSSPQWRDHFVDQFVTLRQLAWDEDRHLQAMAEPPPAIDLAPPAQGPELVLDVGDGAPVASQEARLLLPRLPRKT